MPGSSNFDEDLPQLAAESFVLSKGRCRSCGRMHALWPYLRLARASTGAEAASSRLQSVLSALIAKGRRNVLIAGAADTGLLAQVARAGGDADPQITVLDRCGTPLELCRRQAQHWSIRIRTALVDLRHFDPGQRRPESPAFDVVLVHGTLHFIAAEHRADVLKRLRRALAPGGRLVLLFNTSRRIAGPLTSQGRDGYADWVIDELARIAVPLPEPPDAFRARLRRHATRREDREGAFAAPEDVDALLGEAGFEVCERFEITTTLADPVKTFVAKIDKRRFLAVAAPS
jgi:SAM-dependent methyltransferase